MTAETATAAAQPSRVPPVRTRMLGNQALLRLQRKCACEGQGTCLACRAQTRMIQMKVAVGPVDDPFEREADAVADRVMRMPDAQPAQSRSAASSIQRSCAACEREEDDEEVVRRQARHPVRAGVPELADSDLVRGGAPLPLTVRGFFEQRFGRDFSSVRIHEGSDAHRANVALHSHAFTFGHHIWLGRGETVASNRLLAHELAHVVQQRQPALLPSTSPSVPAVTDGTSMPPTAQRSVFDWYWEPANFNGDRNHEMIVPRMGAANSIFTEAPIPNAKTHKGLGFGQFHGWNLKGRADFYRASTTIGAYFRAHGRPLALPTSGEVRRGNAGFSHSTLAAPRVVRGALVNSANAPTNIELGELKPGIGTVSALVGNHQVNGYKQGIELAHREARDPATPGDGSAWPDLTVSLMGASALTVPDMFQYPAFSGQPSRDVHLKKGVSNKVDFRVRPRPARLAVVADTANAGVWNYAWVPDATPTAAELPASLSGLPAEVTQRIYNPLLIAPVGAQPKARTDARPSLHVDPARVIRCEARAPQKDPFDHDKWRADHKALTERFGTAQKSQEFKDAEGDILATQTHEALRSRMHLNLPAIAGGKEAAKSISKIDFWTGPSALPFGLFRKVFGTAFVKVAQFFVRMRDRVRSFIDRMKVKAGIGSGALGAALKAVFRGLKMIMKFVAGRVTDRLMQSLATGVMNRLTALIPPEVSEELEVEKARIEKIRADIERKALETVDRLLEQAFGVHLKDLEKLHEVYQALDAIVTIVNLVRWGARVIACLSPPAFGCLWILAEAALDYAMQKVVETCWFQQKIKPFLAKVHYVSTELPNALADAVIARVKGFLPDSVSDVFAELDRSEVNAEDEDTPCESGQGGEFEPHPLHDELEALYQRLGEEKAQAVQELAKRMNVPKDRPLKSEELKRLGDELLKLDAAAIRALAQNYPAQPDGSSSTLSDTLKAIEGGQIQETPVSPATGDKPVDKSSEPPASSGDGDTEGGGQGGGLSSVDASDLETDEPASGEIPDAFVRVVNPSWNHTLGDKVKINVLVSYHGEAVMLIKGLPVEVGRRYWNPPSAKTAAEALELVIPYKVLKAARVPKIPNAVIGRGSVIPAGLLTRAGEKFVSRVHEAQAGSQP